MFLIELEENLSDPMLAYIETLKAKILQELTVRTKDGDKVDINVRIVVGPDGGFSQEQVDGNHVIRFTGELVKLEGAKDE